MTVRAPNTRLVFSRPRHAGGPVHLVFGEQAGAAPLVTGTLDATFPASAVAATGTAQYLFVVTGNLAAAFPPLPQANAAGAATILAVGALNAVFPSARDVTASGTAQYLTLALGALNAVYAVPEVPTASGAAQYRSLAERPVVGRSINQMQRARSHITGVQPSHRATAPTPAGARALHRRATPSARAVQHRMPGLIVPLYVPFTAPYDDAPVCHGDATLPHRDAAAAVAATSPPHRDAASVLSSTALPHQDGTHIYSRHAAGHEDARAAVLHRRASHQPATPSPRPLRGRHQDGRVPPPGRSARPLPPVRPPRVPSPHLVFACPPWAGGPVHLVFGHVCRRAPGPVSVPIRRVYVTINEIDLRRVDGDVTLGVYTFNMTLDADSWTFNWSATLHKSAEPLVTLFDELEARINGVPYRLAVGKVARDNRFPETRLKVSGRGLAQVLADPQAPVVSYSATTDRTAQQLMADVLTVNGVSMGWDIDWGLIDWLIPANAWTFQGTAMQALVDIAGAAGGYIQPHPTARTLRVLPRYPSVPWTWGSVTPDLELPGQVVEVESMERLERPAYNGVFVGGTSTGVFGPVTRDGTAGDVLAPQVNHALITDADAHRQRGLAVLADTGRQVHLSLSLPVLPETGVILPGPLVRYVADQTRVGIVRSTSLTWDSPVMRQTIGVECHEPA